MLEPKICADLDIINPRRTCAARVMVVVVIGTITTIRKSPLSNKITQEVSPFTICSRMREIFRKVIHMYRSHIHYNPAENVYQACC